MSYEGFDYDNDDRDNSMTDEEALKVAFFENLLKSPVGREFIYSILSISGVTVHGMLQDTERKQCYEQGKSFIGGIVLNKLKQYAPKLLIALLINGTMTPTNQSEVLDDR